MPEKRAYAVIDTNILVSALWTANPDSPPVKIIDCVFGGRIVPIVHRKILREYNRVLHYDKFSFPEGDIKNIVHAFKRNGIKNARKNLLKDFRMSPTAFSMRSPLRQERSMTRGL